MKITPIKLDRLGIILNFVFDWLCLHLLAFADFHNQFLVLWFMLVQTLEMLEKKEKVLQKKAAAEVERAKEFTRAKNKRCMDANFFFFLMELDGVHLIVESFSIHSPLFRIVLHFTPRFEDINVPSVTLLFLAIYFCYNFLFTSTVFVVFSENCSFC